jgi:putative acetyltransferase
MSMSIRIASPHDLGVIADVHRMAFGSSDEPRLVELVIASDRSVPELSIVAIGGEHGEHGAIVGHILLSAVSLDGDDGRTRDVLALAPLAVLPAYQGRGIGSELVRHALAEADRLGWPLVVLLGHPGYYPRFGFEPASRHGIRSPFDVPDGAFMAKPLAAYDPSFRGAVRYPPAFDAVT